MFMKRFFHQIIKQHIFIYFIYLLKKVDVIEESLIGQNCVVNYDGLPYPGIVMDVDEENGIEAKVMNKIGVNRFFGR